MKLSNKSTQYFFATDADLPPLSQYHWCVLGASIFLGAAMEAYTHQIDNLILGVFQFALCIAFL